MPTVLEEPADSPSLRFTFDDDWQVRRLDTDECFTRRLMPLQVTGAVDFLGIYRDRELYFIEVKDFRGFPIELKNEEKLSEGDTLFHQIGRKVKDSVACIVGATRRDSGEFWTRCAHILHDRSLAVKAVFWLEFDLPRPPRRRQTQHDLLKQEADTRLKELKPRVAWLTREVLLINQSVFPEALPGVTVENTGRAGAR